MVASRSVRTWRHIRFGVVMILQSDCSSKIVLAWNGDVNGRNSEPENPSRRIHGTNLHAELGPIGTITGSEHGGIELGASSAAPALSIVSPRKIKPLRKSLLPVGGLAHVRLELELEGGCLWRLPDWSHTRCHSHRQFRISEFTSALSSTWVIMIPSPCRTSV